MASGYGKIGKQYVSPNALRFIPDSDILIEAAIRTGQPMSKLIEPSAPSNQRIALQEWKTAGLLAKDPENPNRSLLLDVYENIMIDLHLTSIIDNRILRLQQTRFKVTDKTTGDEDEELTELFEAEWFEEFLKYTLEAKFYGFSLIEMMNFQADGLLDSITLFPRKHVISEKGIVVKEVGDDNGTSYLDPRIAPYYLPIGDPKSLGLLYKVAPNILAKKFAQGNWGEYNEKIGIPFRWATSNAVDDERYKQLGVIMGKMGSAGWAVLREGEKVEMLENAKGDPTKCFENLLYFLDSQASKLILGQDGTTNHSDNKGTFGSLQILQEVANDRHEADKTFAKNVINSKLFPRLAQIGAYPLEGKWFEWDDSVELGVKDLVAVVKDLSMAGFKVNPQYIEDKTGIKIDGYKSEGGDAREEEEDPETKPAKRPAGGQAGKKPVRAEALVRFSALYDNTCKKCNADIQAKLFDKELETITRKLWEGKLKAGQLDNDLVKKFAALLSASIESAFDTDPDEVDQEAIRFLKENTQLFSGFKSYQHLKDASALLVDSDGKVRSFAAFKKAVKDIHSTYYDLYLRAEYNHAIASSQMASQWITVQSNKKALPLLRYDTVKDDRVREAHRVLEGVTRKVDDAFWQTYYPPNGWGCRCLASQIQSGSETDLETVPVPELHPIFKGNVGIDKVIFPESHPYFDIPSSEKKKVTRTVKKLFKDE